MKKKALLRHLVSLYPDMEEKELYARILCGEVFVDGEKVKDPEHRVTVDGSITFREKRFVSRGGEKLDFVLKKWEIDVSGKVFVDAGSSTGGFTQVLLHHGAAHVHSVDVGYNQLDYSLRTRDDVSVHERTNIMDIGSLEPEPHAAVVDLSFRSVVPVIRHLMSIITEKWLITLIKPQFEWRTPDRNFNGVIRSGSVRTEIVGGVIERLWREGMYTVSVCPSPIPGKKGNREYLLYVRAQPKGTLQEALARVRSATESSDTSS